jgi:hypothetical protein
MLAFISVHLCQKWFSPQTYNLTGKNYHYNMQVQCLIHCTFEEPINSAVLGVKI